MAGGGGEVGEYRIAGQPSQRFAQGDDILTRPILRRCGELADQVITFPPGLLKLSMGQPGSFPFRRYRQSQSAHQVRQRSRATLPAELRTDQFEIAANEANGLMIGTFPEREEPTQLAAEIVAHAEDAETVTVGEEEMRMVGAELGPQR